MMRFFLLSLIGFWSCLAGFSQEGLDPHYAFLTSGNYVQDKNFYLFTLIEQVPAAKATLEQDPTLRQILTQQKQRLEQTIGQCDTSVTCWLNAFQLNKAEVEAIGQRLATLGQQNPVLQALVRQHLRPSGAFIRHAQLPDGPLLQAAWQEACRGLEGIAQVYVLGKRGRYPAIDSASYAVKSLLYKRYLLASGYFWTERAANWTLVHQPMLQWSLWLLEMNNRDEAGRHEPMAYGENRKALAYIPSIDWSKYPYAVIMQPGHGPDIDDVPLSPMGKLRIALVAERYARGLAPLIILSGGYVHPFQTPFAEATEMKKALIEHYGIPERAIIIEPHARHTTTNFRNAARLMYRYGIPLDKKSLCTTTADQLIYITDPKWFFKERNLRELGYLPYTLFDKISRHDVEFKPVLLSLHLDPLDPLDP